MAIMDVGTLIPSQFSMFSEGETEKGEEGEWREGKGRIVLSDTPCQTGIPGDGQIVKPNQRRDEE